MHRMSRHFGRTLREAPGDVEVTGHALLLRAGFIRQVAAGIFSELPLGRRSIRRLTDILHEEMHRIGGDEVMMPVIHPADLWQRTGRWESVGSELGRFRDRGDRDMALAMTHEETVALHASTEIQSHRDLPRLIYHIQTKWRDDPRPRAGLIRTREFTMLDSYSLDHDEAGLDRQYDAHDEAYLRMFARCGLPVIPVDADVGVMGGSASREYHYPTDMGEDTLLICDGCGYRANRQVATFARASEPVGTPGALTPVETPETTTIDALAKLLDIPPSHTAKAVFLMGTFSARSDTGGAPAGQADGPSERLVLAIVRGDMDVNETKVSQAVGAGGLRPAHDEEIRATGAVPGYASAVGLASADVTVVVDPSVAESPGLVAGANEEGVHLRGVRYERDFTADVVADIAVAQAGDPCPECSAALREHRGVEVGNIFKLGTRYTEALGAQYTDPEGDQRPVVMGSYGLGVGRTLQCVAEEHHDEDGLMWPISVAPFDVHIVSLSGVEEAADDVAAQLDAAGLDVLLDDREERAGVKFADADLIGVPIRITVGSRGLEKGGVEMVLRRDPDRAPELVPLDEVVYRVSDTVDELHAELAP